MHLNETHDARAEQLHWARLILSAGTAPLVLGTGVALAAYWAAGASLGLFCAPVLLVTFIAPLLTVAERTLAGRLIVALALVLGIGVVWGAVGTLSWIDDARCTALLATYVFALSGTASVLQRARVDATYAAAITVLLGIAWLTWPIWLSPWLTGPAAERTAAWLTVAHPLLSLNGVLVARFNAWDRYPIAYQQLTTLNQDVLYTMPKTIAWSVLLHAGIGGAGLAAWTRGRRANRPVQAVAPLAGSTGSR